MRTARIVAACLLLGASHVSAVAQSAAPENPAAYPSRTVRLVVPSTAGGPIDAVTRILADGLRAVWTVSVIVENKPGAGTSTGGIFVAQSDPDGYTLLVNPDSIAVNPSLYPNLPYDPVKSFEPVSMLVTASQVLVVRPDLGVANLQEFIALAKQKQKGLNLASAGPGTISHLTEVLLEQRAGFTSTHVPFRGASPALSAMLGGHVDGMWVMLAPAVPHLKSGKLKALAVASPQRDKNLPDVPTAVESGLPDFLVTNWQALFAPAGTPRPIVEKLAATVVEVLKRPEIRERMQRLGFEPHGGPGTLVTEQIRASMPRWSEVVQRAGIKAAQ
jgi:tripartite-type tricarboxylate transporter receptor subunit TctC